MIRVLLLSAVSVWALGDVALAQQTGSASAEPGTTSETDQSEEDWRRSRRVESGDPFDPDANTSDRGWGTNLPPMRPVDHLPPESRRHLSQQRARAIAEMDMNNPQPQQVAYEPSDAAQSDPGLRQQEEAVWAEMVGDLNAAKAGGGQGDGDGSGSGAGEQAMGGGQAGAADGTGSANGSPGSGSVMAGGANQSAADILRQMRGGGAGNAPQSQPQPANQPGTAPSMPQSGGSGGAQPASSASAPGPAGSPAAGGAAPTSQDGGEQTDGAGEGTQGVRDAADISVQQSAGTQGAAGQPGGQGASDADASRAGSGRQTSASEMIEQASQSAVPSGGVNPGSSGTDGEETAAQEAASGSDASQEQSSATSSASPQNSQDTAEQAAPPPPPRRRSLWEILVEAVSGNPSGVQEPARAPEPEPEPVNRRSDQPLFEPGSSQAERARELREQVERQRADQP